MTHKNEELLLTCLYCDGFNFGCKFYEPQDNKVCRRYDMIERNLDAVVDMLDGRLTDVGLVEVIVGRELQIQNDKQK